MILCGGILLGGSSVVNEPRRMKPRPTVGVVVLSNVSTFNVLALVFIAVRFKLRLNVGSKMS